MGVKNRLTFWAMVVLLGLGVSDVAQLARAGDKKDAKKIESKAEAGALASSINFNKELGLDLPTLTTLGVRIEAARGAADPVALATLGAELAVAEKVSEKMASLKSEALLTEATTLAKVRFNPTELKAVSLITDNKELLPLAAKADKMLANNRKAREAGESTRGIQGTLHVDSRIHGVWLRVFVDGRFVGTVSPYGDSYFFIGQTPWETTYLSASSNDGRRWNGAVGNAVGDYLWKLVP